MGRVGASIVKPVHHTIRYTKAQLSQRYRSLLIPKSSIESSAFRPWITGPDRVKDYHHNTVAQDLLLMLYNHHGVDRKGVKMREWDGSSPYHLNRPLRPPRGRAVQTKDVKKRDWTNVPDISSVTVHTFVKEASEDGDLVTAARLQLQQITGQKPKTVYAKTNDQRLKLRAGNAMGAKVTIKGRPMNQFLSTLCEIVLPRIRYFRGLANRSGDGAGNISFTLRPQDAKSFPELESNLDLWPKTVGFQVTINTTAQVDPDARTLLSAYGFPFRGREQFPFRW